MTYTRILVPLDGSRLSEEVLPYAAGMARAAGVPLAVMRVASDEREVPEAREYLQGIAASFPAAPAAVPIEKDVAGAVLREAAAGGSALVAMTTHGRTGLPGVVVGSVANEVLHRAEGPVLLYRPAEASSAEAAEIREIRTVLLALDGSDFAERMEQAAAEMAGWLGADVQAVQAIPEAVRVPAGAPGDVLESSYVHLRAEQIAAAYGVRAEWEVLHGSAADAICDYVRGRKDVILAMTSHGRSGLSRAIFGSVAGECMRRAGVPILVRALSE